MQILMFCVCDRNTCDSCFGVCVCFWKYVDFCGLSYILLFPPQTLRQSVNIPEEVHLCPKQLIGMTPFSNVSGEHDNIDNVRASTNLLWSKLNSVSWCPQLMLEGSQKPLWLMLVDGSFFSSVNPSCGQSEENTIWRVHSTYTQETFG